MPVVVVCGRRWVENEDGGERKARNATKAEWNNEVEPMNDGEGKAKEKKRKAAGK